MRAFARSIPVLALALAMGAVVGCGGGGDKGSVQPPSSGGATGTVNASQPTTVSVSEGSLKGSAVVVPAGAMPDGTQVSIAAAQAPAFAASAMGPVVQLRATQGGSPLGAFAGPVTVTIPYVASQIPSGKSASDLVLYTAPDASGTPTMVAGATVDTGKAVMNGQVAHFSLFFVGLAAAPTTRTLNASYRFLSTSGMLWTSASANGGAHNTANGNRGTIAFTDQGTCTVAYSEFEFHERNSGTTDRADQVQVDGPKTVNETGTYTLQADGHLVAKIGSGTLEAFVSPDGKLITTGGDRVDVRTGNTDPSQNGTMHEAHTFLAVKTGTGKTQASLNGTYSFHSTDRGMWLDKNFPQVHQSIGASTGTLSFDGKGGFSLAFVRSEAIEGFANSTGPWANEVRFLQDPEATLSGSYTVTPEGEVKLSSSEGELLTLFLGADDQVFLFGGAQGEVRSDGTLYTTDAGIGIKRGAGLGVASLKGTFHMHGCDFLLWHDTAHGMVSDGMWGNSGTFVFDGKGGFTLTHTGRDMMEDYAGYVSGPWALSVRVTPEKQTLSGTYTVDPDGTLRFSIVPTVFQLSADGAFFSNGHLSPESRTDGTLYQSSRVVGLKLQ